MAECCGRNRETPYCPLCGKKLVGPGDPSCLLAYLKSQRTRTVAWVKRYERNGPGALSEDEVKKRMAKHQATIDRWDAWIAWVEARAVTSDSQSDPKRSGEEG